MKEIKVDSGQDCPFRYEGICNPMCAVQPATDCDDGSIPTTCPLRRDSIIVNIGSLGLADKGGKVS